MNKIRMGKEALILSVLTLITVINWIGFQVYWTFHQNTIPEATKKQMETLNPKIKTETLESLKTKISFSEEELNTITPESTESAQPAR